MTAADRLARVLQRLAETQRNLPVSLTDEEREDLRHAAHLLAGPPYKDPEWLPQSRVDCYRFGWETAAAALAPRGVLLQCRCGRMQYPPAGARQWRCDCGAMTFIASGGR